MNKSRTLINGSIRPEFGNPEHIKIVRESAYAKELFEKEGIIYDSTIDKKEISMVELYVKFRCGHCFNEVKYFDDSVEEDEIENTIIKCLRCNTKYEISEDQIRLKTR